MAISASDALAESLIRDHLNTDMMVFDALNHICALRSAKLAGEICLKLICIVEALMGPTASQKQIISFTNTQGA